MNKAMQASPNNAQEPKEVIFSQPLPLGVRRSAWWLYLHELERINPKTGKKYTPRRALINVMGWMNEQRLLLEVLKQRPTPTQLQLLQMMVDGMSQKEIAYALKKNYGTMAIHFMQLRQRMHVESMYQAIAIATKRGWVRVRQDKSEH